MALPGISSIRSSVGTEKPADWGTRFPGRGGDTGDEAFQFNVINLNAWLKSMEEDWRDAKEEAVEALRESLRRRVLQPSLAICPIDTGALRASAWADASYKSGYLQGAVGYDTDYALFVHEIPAAHKSPTRWKFLEEPFTANAYLVAEDVFNAILKEFA